MRTLTLSESVIRIHLGFSRSKSPLKHFNSSSFVSAISQSRKPKHFNRNLSLLLSGYPSQCSVHANANEKSIDYFFSQSSSSDATDEGVRFRSGESCREAFHLAHEYHSCVTNKNVAGISSRNEEMMSMSLEPEKTAASDTMPHSWLKFSVLLWFLTLQGSEQAIAAPGFANGLESVPYLGDLGDITTGFASAFLLIFFSELGDKTFFIAALLAARNSAAIIFVGTFGALAAMTIISVVLGRTFHYVDNLLPFSFGETDLPLDDIAAVCLLVYFGVSTLTEAASGDGLKTEEEQKEAELAVSEFSGNGAGILAAASTVINTFLLVFVAEWGDKSFFSTIALAAASSPLGVIGGALAGHAVATMLAVLGGSLLGTFLSEKVIAYVGGSLFLVFAAVTLIEIFN